jgi:DNA-binding CsgD family transcriptional regulator
VGLTWDASRLAGQAAARTADGRARALLFGCARSLGENSGEGTAQEPQGAEEPTPGHSSGSRIPAGCLSDREREVASLVLDGQTYREIGGRLFISAKTVEHHVSRMRQRLGAGTRSDLLARLRAELDRGRAEPQRAR